MLFSFDVFRDDGKIETASEADDRADDRARRFIVGDMADEAKVNLDLVERESLEVGKRRVAGSKIVHHDPHAERF